MLIQKNIKDLSLYEFNLIQKQSLGNDSEFCRITLDALMDDKSKEFVVINSNRSNIFIKTDEEGMVGWSCCLDYKKYSFIMIFINEKKRRKGYGEELLKESFNFCSKNGIKEVRFSSNDDSAIRLFSKVSYNYIEIKTFNIPLE